MRNQKFHRQAKAERVQHHQNSFVRNVKWTSLNEERHNTKLKKYERRGLTDKGKYTVKTVNQSCKKGGPLKDKSSKSIYCHRNKMEYRSKMGSNYTAKLQSTKQYGTGTKTDT